MRDFAVGGAALGSLSAWYFYTYASIQLPVGMLMDRFGPRKLMSFTMGMCAIASVGFGLSESILSASASRALIGAAVGFAFVGTLTIAGYWFSAKRFALLTGILMSVGMMGAILGQAPLRFTVEQIGWRDTSIALAALAIVLSISLFFIVPKRPLSQKNKIKEGHTVWSGLRAVCSRPQSWYCAVIGFGLSAIMLAFAGLWSVPWLNTTMGFSKTQAAGMSSMLFLGWACASPIAGWLSDYIGYRKPIIYFSLIVNTILFAVIVYSGVIDST